MMTAAQPSSTQCPAASLALEAIDLLHKRRRFETRSDDLFRAALDRLEKVEQAAAQVRATSGEGLFFQACIALAGLDWWDTFDPGETDEQREVKARSQSALEGVAFATFRPSLAMLAEFYLPAAVQDAIAA